MSFEFKTTKISDVVEIQPQVFGDGRGYFVETFKAPDFELAGISVNFVQDNESSSTKGVLRGLHFQKTHTQGKLVRVTQGEVFDVAVDVRPGSVTYGQWVGVTLSAEKKNMLWVPAGFAHGFLVISDAAKFVYKCTDIYDPSGEGGIHWHDKTIGVEWPKLDCEYKTSEKDEKHPAFKDQSFEWAEKYI